MLTILAVKYPDMLRVISPESNDTGDIISDLKVQGIAPSGAMLIRDETTMWSGPVYKFLRGMGE